MIGTTLACTLGTCIFYMNLINIINLYVVAKNPKLSETKILLLEAGPDKIKPITERYSNRVSAINPQTRDLLERIGVWKRIQEKRYAPVKRLQVFVYYYFVSKSDLFYLYKCRFGMHCLMQ